jgi:ATP-dependent DNA ligase
VKSKCRAGHEVVIGGYTMTSLLVGVHRGNGFVYVGRVGTGFGAAKVKTLLRKLQALKAPKSPFTGLNASKKELGVVWLNPEAIPWICAALHRVMKLGRHYKKPALGRTRRRGWPARFGDH